MHVTDQPTPVDVTHDVFDAGKGYRNTAGIKRGIRLVEHHQKNSGNDLHRQNDNGQAAEEIPEVEVFRCVILG